MKKYLTILLAGIITFSLAVQTASAATAASTPAIAPAVADDVEVNDSSSRNISAAKVDEKALQEAILAVKSRITIPADYKKFDFSAYASNYNNTANSYRLSWTREGDNYAYINVTISAANIITSYNAYDSTNNGKSTTAHFALLSNQQLYNKATALVKKLNPDIYSSLSIEADSFSSYIGSNNCNFQIKRVENGVVVQSNGGYIDLNKDTGALIGFNFSWVDGAKFQDTKDSLTQEQIKESYTTEIGLTPVYRVITDYEKKTKSAILLYLPKDSKYLDAFTGKISDFVPNFYGDYAANPAAGAAESSAQMNDDAGGLTPEEQAAVNVEKGLITSADAIKIIKDDKYNAFTQNSVCNSVYLNQDYFDPSIYRWVLYFKDGSATVNAKTGAIENYYTYNSDTGTAFNEKTADANTDAALKSYLGLKYGEYKLESSEILNDKPEISPLGVTARSAKYYGKSYTYVRYANGIKVENDYINVVTDYKGLLRSFNYEYSSVKFPIASDILTEEEALKKLYEQQDLDLNYYINRNEETGVITTALLYTMRSFNLDAKTGSLVEYNGDKIAPKNSGGYNDIENHYIKQVAQKLYENGITLPTTNGKLRPDAAITEADFINLVSSISTEWEAFYYDYRYRVYNQKTASSISVRNAVKCTVTALGGKKFADLKGLYAAPFTDIAANDADLGYFALAKAMGIITGDANGNITPSAAVSRAYALQMIYNYLNANTETLRNS